MKKSKKLLAFLLVPAVLVPGGLRARAYMAASLELRDTAAYYAEKLMLAPETANTLIPYDMLSARYQTGISEEQYTAADEPEEWLALYTQPVFRQNRKRKVDISLSTDGYKKTASGYLVVGEQWYYIAHEIDVAPDWLTLKPKIVRWNITAKETEVAIKRGVLPDDTGQSDL